MTINKELSELLDQNKISLFWDSLNCSDVSKEKIKNRATNIYVGSRKTVKESILEAIDEINRNKNKPRQGE